jgi:lipopolysaccharide export LptBFGC system permease protein LptF
MSKSAPQPLLRRHAAPFAIAFVSLTAILMANYAARLLPQPGANVEALLLAVPFTAAITIPMAVFIAVLWVFTRLGAEGALVAAQNERGGIRRLVTPVIAGAAVVAAMTFMWDTQLVPRANARLAGVLARDAAPRQSDRTMTVGELQAAARTARAETAPDALGRAASFEVEIQKKYALAAACMILAFAAAAIGVRFPRGGNGLVIGASIAVFGAYYTCLVAGETLADRLVVSPFVGMWSANALLIAAASLLLWSASPRRPRAAHSLAMTA